MMRRNRIFTRFGVIKWSVFCLLDAFRQEGPLPDTPTRAYPAFSRSIHDLIHRSCSFCSIQKLNSRANGSSERSEMCLHQVQAYYRASPIFASGVHPWNGSSRPPRSSPQPPKDRPSRPTEFDLFFARSGSPDGAPKRHPMWHS